MCFTEKASSSSEKIKNKYIYIQETFQVGAVKILEKG